MQTLIEKIKPFSHLQAYKKGGTLYFQGETPRRGAVITRGVVRSYAITASGEERTIAFFTQGDILPLSWLMKNSTTCLFHYQAVTDVRTLQFTQDDFHEKVLTDSELVLKLFNTLSKGYTAAMLRINGLEQSKAEDKIAYTLYYLVFRYGLQKEGDPYHTIAMTLRHSTIAGLVGLSRESTTKILGQFQRDGIISYQSGQYRVDKSRIEAHIGEDVFNNVIAI